MTLSVASYGCRDSMKINVVERVSIDESTYFPNLSFLYRGLIIVGEEHDVVYSEIAIVAQNVLDISCTSWQDTRGSPYTRSNLPIVRYIHKTSLPTILEATQSDIRSPLEMLIPDPM
jgi:hypothetical protein